MAIRYSGTLKIRINVNARNDGWIARISEAGHHIGTATVSEPRAARIAIDSPEAYDGAARAAIAFTDGTEGADTDESGIIVTRYYNRCSECGSSLHPVYRKCTCSLY